MNTLDTIISIFPSALAKEPDHAMTLRDFLAAVKGGRWERKISILREHIHRGDRVRYDHKKRELPAVTLSCHCLSRERDLTPEAKEITHSGWLQADFDLKDNPILSTLDSVAAIRAALLADPHVGAVFVGPSGEGIKAVVCIDPEQHKDSWFAAEAHFRDVHGLKLDRATKDPMRLCFVSHDPDLATSEEFSRLPLIEKLPEKESWRPAVDTTTADIEEMLTFIPPRPDYDTWLRIASAVWSVLPMEDGARILHRWSPEERDGEYASKHKARLKQVGIGTLCHIAAQHGFDAAAAWKRKRWAGRIRFADSERGPGQGEDPTQDTIPAGQMVAEVSRERVMQAFSEDQAGDARLWCEMRRGIRTWNIHAKMWMIYEDGVWRRDAANETMWDMSDTLCSLYTGIIKTIQQEMVADGGPAKGQKGQKDPRDKEIAGLRARCVKLRSWDYLSGIDKFAKRELFRKATEFDASPTILALDGGMTLDFAEGVAREHRSADYVTVRSPIVFVPEAECPLWEDFLELVIPDPETRQYLARAVGYSLTGLVHADALFFCYGKGANGKSTFFGVLKMLLGDLMTTVPIAALLAAKADNNFDYHKASMEGKRVVLTDEIPEGRSLADSQVKAITGGDPVNARRPYEVPYVFMPTHKLWLMGNHKPEIKGTDEGIWRRVHMIPFLVTIPEHKRRPRHEVLMEFKREASGILNWAIRGLLASRDIGLCPPAQVVEATQEYREESDQFGAFLAECVQKGITGRVKIADLSKCYFIWCEKNGETPRYRGTRKMRSVMDERGYVIEPDRNDHPTVHGIQLRQEESSNTLQFEA